MKRKMMALMLCSAMVLSSITAIGCGRSTPSKTSSSQFTEAEKKNMTVLQVSNYGAGFGRAWLDKAISRFQAEYAKTSFETGKTGIAIEVVDTLSSGMGWVNQVSSRNEDIFFTEQAYYPDAVSKGLFLDISDIVTENLAEKYGESGTIESKLNEEQKSYYKINDKYYGLPHYAGYFGITYDVDLFEEKNLYINAARDGFVTGEAESRSVGVDGVSGTADDGLPITYDEFFLLCNEMLNVGVTPVIWSGASKTVYMNCMLNALYADAEGKESFMRNFDLQGETEIVKDFDIDENGAISNMTVSEETLDFATGYKVFQQPGRAYALSFIQRILSGNYYAGQIADTSFSHTEAQKYFLESNPKGQPIGMLIDGNFWDAEAGSIFTQIENYYPGEEWKRENRRFGFMPYPKATDEQVGEKTTLFDYLYSCAFINAKIPQNEIKAAKAFLQFLYTDKSLVEFTTTNTPKALSYELNSEEFEKVSTYGQSVWEIKNTADVAYPFADNALYLTYQSQFNLLNTWVSLVGQSPENSMITALHEKELSAKDIFLGLKNYQTEERWNTQFASVLK